MQSKTPRRIASLSIAGGRVLFLVRSAIDHVALIGACYLVAILASQLMLYLRDGDWTGAALPLFSKLSGTSDILAHDGLILSSGIGRYLATDVNALVPAGAFLVCLLAARLTLGIALGSAAAPLPLHAGVRAES